ncbi:MAG: heme o synthase [Calditrichaceae bacterium]
MKSKILAYFQLTKPTIMLLVVVTGATALVMEGSLLGNPAEFLLVLVALYLTGGAANALNQYFERDIDAKMTRTSGRRPLPRNKIPSKNALIFSVFIGTAGILIFGIFFNWFSAALSMGTILFYSLFYTLFLKPNTPQNIVIGGAAGAMAPVGAWVAATGSMSIDPWILFLIIFFWTPPHFWALALVYKDDYRLAELPMMPVVNGDTKTFRWIIMYSWVLVAVSLTLYFSQAAGLLYAIVAIVLGFLFIKKSIDAKRSRSEGLIKGLFGYSIVYLFGLFLAIIVDGLI